MKPDISVIVPSYGRPEKLRRLLERLTQQVVGPGESFEVVVGLDGCAKQHQSTPPELGALNLRYVPLGRAGAAALRNAAVAESRGALLLFLNDDIEPAHDFVRQHVAAQSAGNPIVLGQSPWQRFGDQTVFDEAIARTRMVFFHKVLERGAHYDFRHAWSLNLSVDRGLIETIRGPFCESLRPLFYEDLEFAFRLIGCEKRVFFHPDARATHNHRYKLAGYFQREALLGVMARELFAVNPGCFEAVFGVPLDGLARRARQALPLDLKDGKTCLAGLEKIARVAWADHGSRVSLDLFYLLHLPLKRRAFRCGLVAATNHPRTSWLERSRLAADALRRDPVLSRLFTETAARDKTPPGLSERMCETSTVPPEEVAQRLLVGADDAGLTPHTEQH